VAFWQDAVSSMLPVWMPLLSEHGTGCYQTLGGRSSKSNQIRLDVSSQGSPFSTWVIFNIMRAFFLDLIWNLKSMLWITDIHLRPLNVWKSKIDLCIMDIFNLMNFIMYNHWRGQAYLRLYSSYEQSFENSWLRSKYFLFSCTFLESSWKWRLDLR